MAETGLKNARQFVDYNDETDDLIMSGKWLGKSDWSGICGRLIGHDAENLERTWNSEVVWECGTPDMEAAERIGSPRP